MSGFKHYFDKFLGKKQSKKQEELSYEEVAVSESAPAEEKAEEIPAETPVEVEKEKLFKDWQFQN